MLALKKQELSVKEAALKKLAEMKANYIRETSINKLKKKWLNILSNASICNQEKDTYTLADVEVTNYGFQGKAYIPEGMNYEGLENAITFIEDSLPCILVLNKTSNCDYADVKIIKKPPKSYTFTPPMVKPFQAFLGIDYSGENYIIDFNELPHMFISGCTGSGKSKMVDQILTSLIHSCSQKELELYLVQLAKEDLYIYEYMEQVKYFATTIEKVYLMLKYVYNTMLERNKVIIPLKRKGLSANIIEYNKIYPHDPMPYMIVVIDEFPVLMPDASDSSKVKKQKSAAMAYLEKLSGLGRSAGIFLIISLQKSTKDKLPKFVKDNCNVIVGFKQKNKNAAEVALDDHSVLGLKKREAIVEADGRSFIKTLDLPDTLIVKLLKNKSKPYHKTLDLKIEDDIEE